VERRLELAVRERLLDAASDAPRRALLAELVDHVGELVLREARDELERRLAARGIHAHVERSLEAEAHTALGVRELLRAHSEIGEHASNRVHSERREPLGDLREDGLLDARTRA